MSESAYSLYTPPDSPRKAGLARVATARGRDRWGRLLPNDPTKELKPALNHGRAGGLKRAQTGKRNKKGEYIKCLN